MDKISIETFAKYSKLLMLVPLVVGMVIAMAVMVVSIYFMSYGLVIGGLGAIIVGLFNGFPAVVGGGFISMIIGGGVYDEYFISHQDMIPITKVPKYIYERFITLSPL